MTKKLGFLLLLALCLSVLLLSAAMAEPIASGSCGDDVTWTLSDSGLLTISGTGAMNNYTFGGAPWYSNRMSIKTVQIESGVTSIGEMAFISCSNLTSVSIPDGVDSIGNHAFNSCSSLTSIVLPDSVTSMGWRVFQNCGKLTSIRLSAGLRQIDTQTFFEIPNLTSIQVPAQSQNFCAVDGILFNKNMTAIVRYPSGKTDSAYQIPAGITTLNSYAFYGCVHLTSITIPESVSTLDYNVFSECVNLANIFVSSDSQYFCDVDGIMFTKNMKKIVLYPSARSGSVYQIPDGVTMIGDSSFENCANLTDIQIPEGVTYLGIGAFFRCTSLTHVTIPQGLTRIGDFSFQNCTSLTSITIPSSVTSIGFNTFSGCTRLTDVYYTGSSEQWAAISIDSGNEYLSNAEIHYNYSEPEPEVIDSGACGQSVAWTLYDSGLLTITGTGAMDDYNWIGAPWYDNRGAIQTVQIENGVTRIGDYAFYACTKLAGVTIPSSMISIGNYAFSNCTSLTGVTIPNGVTSIGTYAFADSKNLASVTIPESVTSIGATAFTFCPKLNSIQVDSGSTTFASVDGVLFNKAKTTLVACPGGKTGEYTIPSGVISIGTYAFCACKNLTGVSIPESVTTIADSAFYSCSGLTSVTIPDSVISIGNEAFRECKNMTSAAIPSSVTSIGKGLFRECTSLASVTIASGVTTIGNGAFYNCTSLTGLILPSSVTKIENAAFAYCSGLTSVTIPASVTSIGENPFLECTSLESIQVESGSTAYASVDGVLFDKAKTSLITCPGGKSGAYVIPSSVTSLGERAFSKCSSLTSVTIPDSVTSIGAWMFNECSSLTSVTIPSSVTSIGYYTFFCCNSLTDVYYTGSSEQWAAVSIESGNECLTNAEIYYAQSVIANILTLPASLTVIESEAFTGLPNVDAVSIPATVTSIADDAFDTGIVIIAPAGSYAESWANDHGFTVNHP